VPQTPFRVLFVTSEVTPFRKTGGLADVAGALPKALAERGMDVRVVMPLYGGIAWNELETMDGVLGVPTFRGWTRAGVRKGLLPGSSVPIYFLEHHHYFDRPYLYGPPGDAYGDNLERFSFLARASLSLCYALGFTPDVVHAHDWQAALVPAYLNTLEWGRQLHGTASILTIHNLAYQGVFDPGAHFITGLGWEHLRSGEFEHFGDLNLLKGGIVHSTYLSTVSPTYCQEIQMPEHGFGLDGVLRSRSNALTGILNGIDTAEWNPERDVYTAARFSADDLSGKAVCKRALQERLGLPPQPDIPLFATIGRLTEQKGYDVLARCLDQVLSWKLQLVLLGSGDPEAEVFFREMNHAHPERFRAVMGYDTGLSHQIEAGADFFLMPSRFEPCGLNQMYSQRYGTLPLVRRTGGLNDTVENYQEALGSGTGFVFDDLTPEALANTIGWALSTYHDRPEHIAAMQRQAMRLDRSWARSAEEYERTYHLAYERRRGHAWPGGGVRADLMPRQALRVPVVPLASAPVVNGDAGPPNAAAPTTPRLPNLPRPRA
jgi:starch synthase